MDALKSQLLRIQEQLSGLSASQKMLTASLVAIMVMTMLWWARYAGTAEMEPLLDQAFTAADAGSIRMALTSQQIPFTVSGDRILVPSDRKYEALAVLAMNNNLPSNSYAAWDEMLKQSTLWDSSAKTAELNKHMKERLLSDWMTAHFPGVANATVFINDVAQRRLGSAALEPSATVMIRTRSGAEVKKLISAASAAVASAVAGLTPPHVAVIIDGQSHRVPDPNTGISGEADEKARELAELHKHTLEDMFPPNSRIAVAVDVETTRRFEESEAVDKAKSIITETEIESKNTKTTQPPTQSGDAGLVANSALSVPQIAASGAESTTDSNRTTLTVIPTKTNQRIETPAGKATVFSTAIRIPRSHFIQSLKKDDSAAKDPDETAIQGQFKKELASWVKTAKDAIGMRSEENISIEMYYDNNEAMVAGIGDSAAGGPGFASTIGKHSREVAVGLLAVVSLFMLMNIVKKGSPTPAAIVEVPPVETPHLGGLEDIAGIAGNNASTLDGLELDESAVKSQQMVEQVATMVKENPEAAANLVKRWLNRS